MLLVDSTQMKNKLIPSPLRCLHVSHLVFTKLSCQCKLSLYATWLHMWVKLGRDWRRTEADGFYMRRATPDFGWNSQQGKARQGNRSNFAWQLCAKFFLLTWIFVRNLNWFYKNRWCHQSANSPWGFQLSKHLPTNDKSYILFSVDYLVSFDWGII